MIQTAMTEFARLDNDKNYTVAPMSLCGAMSQGYIGYDLQNAIRTELLDRGIFKPVSTIITQVRVDPFDKAFNHPTKVIGRVMTREEADAEEEKGNHVVPEGDGFRRIIASPKPVDIYEIDAIEALLDAGQIVSTHGIRGEVKLRPITCDLSRFEGLETAYLKRGDAFEPIRLTVNRIAPDAVFLNVDGVGDRTAAERLREETSRVCWTLGRRVEARFTDGSVLTGTATALNADASLSVRDDAGENHVVHTADVGVLPL